MPNNKTYSESCFPQYPTQEMLKQIDSDLGIFPTEEIQRQLDRLGIFIPSSQIPNDFLKYFALIRTLSPNTLKPSLLDFGCGLGVFISQASKLGINAEGLDIFVEYGNQCYEAASCIASCIAPTPPILTCLDFLKEDVPRQADFVTSFGMLEHIHGAEARDCILKKMINALKPGGYLILTCGPNRRFPIDLFHYGPHFIFYHQLPVVFRRLYLKLFAKSSQNQDPTWLQGMSVSEISSSLYRHGADCIQQLFPLWIDLARSNRLRNRLFRYLVVFFSKILTKLKAEPVIIIVAQKKRQN